MPSRRVSGVSKDIGMMSIRLRCHPDTPLAKLGGLPMKSSMVIVTLLSFLSSSAIAATQAKDERRQFEAWRKSMTRVPMPKKGCFKTSYPSTEWREVPCTAAPVGSYQPRPYTVGSAVDFSAVVAGHIASATGSVDSVN